MSVPIPADLARQIEATLAITNNLAFDLRNGRLRYKVGNRQRPSRHVKSRPVPLRQRYTSRVREAFARAYMWAVDENFSVLNVDHILVAFLRTPECQDYFSARDFDAAAINAASNIGKTLVVGQLRTATLLPMTDEAAVWHDAAIKLSKRRPSPNTAVDLVDFFDAFAHPKAAHQLEELDVLASDVKNLDGIRNRLFWLNHDQRPLSLRDLINSKFDKLSSKIGISDEESKNGMSVCRRVDYVVAGVGFTADEIANGHSLRKAHDATHDGLGLLEMEKTVKRRVEDIERNVRPAGVGLVATVLLIASLAGGFAGWLLRSYGLA